jgi:hypothetical protein
MDSLNGFYNYISKFMEAWCETMENEGIGKSGMGINCKGRQGQTERAVVL